MCGSDWDTWLPWEDVPNTETTTDINTGTDTNTDTNTDTSTDTNTDKNTNTNTYKYKCRYAGSRRLVVSDAECTTMWRLRGSTRFVLFSFQSRQSCCSFQSGQSRYTFQSGQQI